jgi:hypothetical protein
LRTNKENYERIEGVDGWLAFFVFGLCVSILLNLYAGLTDIAGLIDLQIPSNYAIGLIFLDILEFGGLIALMIYTIICITSIKPNAVSVAKKYLIFMLISGVIGLILETYNPTLYSQETTFAGGSVRGIFFGVIWLLYFSNSKRVANTYPESKRKSSILENVLFYLLLSVILILFLLGITMGSNNYPKTVTNEGYQIQNDYPENVCKIYCNSLNSQIGGYSIEKIPEGVLCICKDMQSIEIGSKII